MRYLVSVFIIAFCLLSGGLLHAATEDANRLLLQRNVLQLLEKKQCPGCNLSGASLQKLDLSGANLEGANLSNALLNESKLTGANMRNADLRDANLTGADLSRADISGANLIGTIIAGANLAGTVLGGEVVVHKPSDEMGGVKKTAQDVPEKVQDVSSVDTASVKEKKDVEKIQPTVRKKKPTPPVGNAPKVVGVPKVSKPAPQAAKDPVPKSSKSLNKMEDVVVVAKTAQVDQVSAEEEKEPEVQAPDQTMSNPPAAEMESDVVEQAVADEPVEKSVEEEKNELVEKLLDENRCVACDLSGVDLSDRDLKEADLERAILRGANLEDADLEEANLKGADLRGANLREADLRKADMYRADISGADLTEARFEGALIDSMVSEGAIGADLEGAIGNTLNSPFVRY